MAAEASARRPAPFSQRRPKAEEGGEPRPKEEAADEPLPLAAQPYPQTLPGSGPGALDGGESRSRVPTRQGKPQIPSEQQESEGKPPINCGARGNAALDR